MSDMVSLIKENLYCWRYALILASLLSLLSLVSSPSIMANPKSPLVVQIDSFSFPPILHRSESGEFSGTMGETVKKLCEAGDMICSFDVVPLSRAYKNIKSGRTDALITINVGQLNDCCIPSDWASPWRAGFFSTTGLSEIPETPEDLPGKSLIVVLGMRVPTCQLSTLRKVISIIGIKNEKEINPNNGATRKIARSFLRRMDRRRLVFNGIPSKVRTFMFSSILTIGII